MVSSLWNEQPCLYFNGPEVPAVPEEQKETKQKEQTEQQALQHAAYRPEQEQAHRAREEQALRGIESKMEGKTQQENAELIKTLNAQLKQTVDAYPEEMQKNKLFQHVIVRLSFGEENGRTFMAWNVPVYMREMLNDPMGKDMMGMMLAGYNVEVTPGGDSVRLYETPEHLERAMKRLQTMMSSGPVEETAEQRATFDREQKVTLRSSALMEQGNLAEGLKEEENYTKKVNEIKKELPADFAKTRLGTILLNARFVTDGSQVKWVVPEKCAAEFRLFRRDIPNLFKGEIEKDKEGNYALILNERSARDLLFLLADHTPRGGGIDWESDAMKKFAQKYPEVAEKMKLPESETPVPERASLASMQQYRRVNDATR